MTMQDIFYLYLNKAKQKIVDNMHNTNDYNLNEDYIKFVAKKESKHMADNLKIEDYEQMYLFLKLRNGYIDFKQYGMNVEPFFIESDLKKLIVLSTNYMEVAIGGKIEKLLDELNHEISEFFLDFECVLKYEFEKLLSGILIDDFKLNEMIS